MGLGDVFLEVLDTALDGVEVSATGRDAAYLEILEGVSVVSDETELTEFLVFSDGRGPTGLPGADGGAINLDAHINSDNPHPEYDTDGVDLTLIYANAKV